MCYFFIKMTESSITFLEVVPEPNLIQKKTFRHHDSHTVKLIFVKLNQ